jgi:hypothetical protein
VGHRIDLDDVGKRKFLTATGLELRPFGRPTRTQSLYRLRYPGSNFITNKSKLYISVYLFPKMNFVRSRHVGQEQT